MKRYGRWVSGCVLTCHVVASSDGIFMWGSKCLSRVCIKIFFDAGFDEVKDEQIRLRNTVLQ